MPIPCQPPAQQAIQPAVDLPLLPGSDPTILGAYQWTLAHSPSLQQVVRKLASADRKARYRLVPGLERKYSFWVTPRGGDYEIDVEVPVLAWRLCGDALEPWIASALFLVLEVVKDEKYRVRSDSAGHLTFLPGSIRASFAFQNRVKAELQKADPGRLKDLPDGAVIYASHFEPSRWASRQQRRLPEETHPPEPPRPREPTASVSLMDRPIGLPALPRDGAEGRDRLKAVHAQIAAGLEDLKRSLQGLYEKPEAGLPLPANPAVPPEWLAMGSDLLGAIDDPDYLRLERAFLDTWKGWQAALVEEGLAERTSGWTNVPASRSKEYQQARQAAKAVLAEPARKLGTGQPQGKELADQVLLDATGSSPKRNDASWLGPLEGPINKVAGKTGEVAAMKGIVLQSGERSGFIKNARNVIQSQRGQAVANAMLTQLAATWQPLVTHLDEVARRVLDQEEAAMPVKDATLEALRLHARLAVLERFRKAFWYCDLVWCQVAAEEAPPPPPKLSRPLPVPPAQP